MKKHEILSPHSRAALFDPPTDPTAIVRHYTVSPQDLTLILRRRRDPNRLGFAVHLAYLRFPRRVFGAQEDPPSDMLVFIASQIGVAPGFSPAMRGAMKPAGPTLAKSRPILAFARFSSWRSLVSAR
jgi:TnpA family transposase